MRARILSATGALAGPRSRITIAALLAVVVVIAALPVPGTAAEWGTITPGTSTMDTVRQQFGDPSRVDRVKEDNYDVEEWLYEGDRAPAGMVRMVVSFGLVGASGFRRELVRTFLLQPKPGIFDRRVIVSGWGLPDRTGRDDEGDVFFYLDGLVVYFDKDGSNPRSMVFTPPQPAAPPTTPQR